METQKILEIIVLIVGFYMAWNIGANDVSNAMGTSVGSGALTLRRAVIIAAFLEFFGAFLVGGTVSATMQNELIKAGHYFSNANILIFGMCGALLGTSIWLQIASFLGLPVSTTHAIIGAILGFGALVGGFGGIEWPTVGRIALSWIISPLVSGCISYFLFSLLQRRILFAMNPILTTKRLLPLLVFFVFFIFTLSLLFNGLGRLHFTLTLTQAIFLSILIGAITAAISLFAVRRIPTPTTALDFPSQHLPSTLISLEKSIKHLRRVQTESLDATHDKISHLLSEMHDLSENLRQKTQFSQRTSEYQVVERSFGFMQIISACFVAFAHGANDVANAIAPVSAVFDIVRHGTLSQSSTVPTWLLAFGGLGIVIGLATWGWRVILTIGHKITELTPTRGFSAEFGAAITILLASKLGMPISTTHCLVGSVLGVGLARGIRALNLRTLKDIALSWIITIPASALMSILCFYLLRFIFSL